MEIKLQTNLPKMAFIEAQVIHRAASKGVLNEFVRDLERQNGVPPNSFRQGVYLETRIASLLYCLILIPKEIWSLGPNHSVYKSIGEKWSPESATIIKHRPKYNNHPVYYFIYHLRNAIAHARISFADESIIFGDKLPHEEELSFQASISLAQLYQFLEVVGAILANLKIEEAESGSSRN